MSDGLSELRLFFDYWDGRPGFEVTSVGMRRFRAMIEYRSDKRHVDQDAQVLIYVQGYDREGAIEIMEEGKLKAVKYHLGFNLNFQGYRYDKNDHSLLVVGKSDMLGDYIVRILPDHL